MSDPKKEAKRKKSLGELGELFALKALVDQEFDKIRNLNDDKQNFPFADLRAEKLGKKFVISVKARNKVQKNGHLNSRYNLGGKAREHAGYAEKEYDAEAYWMAVQLDEKTYSVYFGSMEELQGNAGIPVGKCMKGEVGECFVRDKQHFFDIDFFSNK